MNLKVELPDFNGFEYTGEFRHPEEGEYFMNAYFEVCYNPTTRIDPEANFFILRPVEQYVSISLDEAQRMIDEGNFPYYLDRTFNEEFTPTWVKKAIPRTQYFKKVED